MGSCSSVSATELAGSCVSATEWVAGSCVSATEWVAGSCISAI
jgi:hypothetical protein